MTPFWAKHFNFLKRNNQLSFEIQDHLGIKAQIKELTALGFCYFWRSVNPQSAFGGKPSVLHVVVVTAVTVVLSLASLLHPTCRNSPTLVVGLRGMRSRWGNSLGFHVTQSSFCQLIPRYPYPVSGSFFMQSESAHISTYASHLHTWPLTSLHLSISD